MKKAFLVLSIAVCYLSSFAQEQGTFKDSRDGKVYKTVKIGNQTWFAENLAFIPSNQNYWGVGENQANIQKFGCFYNWETAKTSCPTGWHLPSDAEWTELTDFLGGEVHVGNKMKASKDWKAPTETDRLMDNYIMSSDLVINTKKDQGKPIGVANSSGFSALPAGSSSSNFSNWVDIESAFFWTSTQDGEDEARHIYLNNSGLIVRDRKSQDEGLTVRCVMNLTSENKQNNTKISNKIVNEVAQNDEKGGVSSASFNPKLTYGTMTDQDGNVYKTIVIGGRTWMAENLRVTTYRNGDPIPNVTDNLDWTSLETGKRCSFENTKDKNKIATYGYLYNYYAVSDKRMIAPKGWHVPSYTEWDNARIPEGWKLMSDYEKTQARWKPYLALFKNPENGFAAMPFGRRCGVADMQDENFYEKNGVSEEVMKYYRANVQNRLGGENETCFWWFSDMGGNYCWALDYVIISGYTPSVSPENGISVRLIKDK